VHGAKNIFAIAEALGLGKVESEEDGSEKVSAHVCWTQMFSERQPTDYHYQSSAILSGKRKTSRARSDRSVD